MIVSVLWLGQMEIENISDKAIDLKSAAHDGI